MLILEEIKHSDHMGTPEWDNGFNIHRMGDVKEAVFVSQDGLP